MLKNLLLCALVAHVSHGQETCGKACHKTDPNRINIHLIPHTHDDVGWLKTVDQYYYGSNKGHTPVGVQYILDSVVSELDKNAARRFVYVETSFFWRWWEEQDNQTKATVHNLVKEGRLEFLHGGWCMSDEATPHYSSLIDQMTLGLKFLNETFGECGRPRVAWQIDPFGHSSEVALEFADMGFDALILGRIDYEDRLKRQTEKQMEMIWRPDPSIGEAGDLFTNVLHTHYSAPDGFCFDILCSDDPIIDNKGLHGYNLDEKILKFEKLMNDSSPAYKTNHMIVTMGGDFTYTSASAWFKNIDKLIKHINERSSTIHLLYSTPACYVNAVNALNDSWSVKDDDDFFPYATDGHSFWTGYFSSRASLKYYVYRTNNLLQAVKQLATTLPDSELKEEEKLIKRSVAIAQHHDGVSGTEKQHVTNDYALYLQEGTNASRAILNTSFKKLFGNDYPESWFCDLRNISQCNITEQNTDIIITLYNPLSHYVSIPVRFPVLNNTARKIYRTNESQIEYDLLAIPNSILKIPGRQSNATYDLVFMADNIPPLGTVSYFVEIVAGEYVNPISALSPTVNNAIITNGIVQLEFNKTTGLLQSISKQGTKWPFHQNFYVYNAMKGYNYNPDTRASGAYVFRPTAAEPKPVSASANITVYQGKIINEVHQTFTPWLSQVIRLYAGREDIAFEWLVGPIPIVDWTGLEIVTRYTTDLASNSVFSTDSNGRRWMKRTRNYRKYWKLTVKEPVSANYYPVTTAINVRDNDRQVTVIVDRPEGGTSMNDGQIELMLHRRLLYDDNFGVVEPLDESAFGEGLVVRGTHVIQLNAVNKAALAHRMTAIATHFAPITTFSSTSLKPTDWFNKFNTSTSLLVSELPPNVNLLTLERWQDNEVLIRLENFFQSNEEPYAHPVNVNLKKLLSIEIVAFKELMLAANMDKQQGSRLKWRYDGQNDVLAIEGKQFDLVIYSRSVQTLCVFSKVRSESINVVPNPWCPYHPDTQEEADANHLLFNCPAFTNQQNQLCTSLMSLGHYPPFHVHSLLSQIHIDTFLLLSAYVVSNNIPI